MWQPVLMINGYLISILGLAMIVPAVIDLGWDGRTYSPFVPAAIITVFIGASLFVGNKMHIKRITLQQGFLLTVVSWVSIILLGSLPFVLSGYVPTYADALFETTSGLSTTGATIFSNLDVLPKSVLLWRAMLNGLGGIGIVIFAVALLPFLGIGGMQVFQRENSDINEKFMPKFSYIAKRILLLYVGFNVVCTGLLYWAGMDWFDAVCHALATVATGGLSTKDASIGYFDNVSVELVITIFMILGAIPMTFYIVMWQGRDVRNFGTSQVWAFLKILIFYILGTSFYLVFTGHYGLMDALRYSSFNIVSIVTTTGFVSTDYMQWGGGWVSAFFIIFALTGGCTGSTSGSIKILRWQVIFSYIRRSMVLSTDPNRVLPIKVGNLVTNVGIISSVFVLFSAFMLSIAVFTVVMALLGYDFELAFSTVVACISNSGPGLGEVVGPAGNYHSLSDAAKYVLSFVMLLGRLEVITVVTILTKSFWSRS